MYVNPFFLVQLRNSKKKNYLIKQGHEMCTSMPTIPATKSSIQPLLAAFLSTPSSTFILSTSRLHSHFLSRIPSHINHSINNRRPKPAILMTEQPSGKYSVSISDVRLPDNYASGLRLRLFYPTSPGESTTPTAPWFPPSDRAFPDDTVLANLRYAKIPGAYFLAMILSHLARKPLPARVGGPLLNSSIPLVLFSHGLAGCAATYSNLCIEIASQGMLVIAPEHSDGSALFAKLGSQKRGVEHLRYNPAVHGPREWDMRKNQLQTRVKDFQEILRALQEEVEFISLDSNALQAPSTEQIRRCVNLKEIRVIGHSFGAATALRFAHARSCKISHLVCLDGWLMPLEKHGIEELSELPDRMLFIDQGLSGMNGSVELRKQINVGKATLVDAVKILGGMHNNSSDYPLRIPKTLAVMTRMTAADSDVLGLLHAQSRAVVSFLESDQKWMMLRQRIQSGEDPFLRLAPLEAARRLPKEVQVGEKEKITAQVGEQN